MGKPNKSAEAPVDTQATDSATAADAAATPAAAKKTGGGGGAIMIERNGVQVKRVDYIREQFAAGRKRGEIAKELGVAYQIVFAATKAPKETEAAAAPAGDAPAADAAAPATDAPAAE